MLVINELIFFGKYQLKTCSLLYIDSEMVVYRKWKFGLNTNLLRGGNRYILVADYTFIYIYTIARKYMRC